MAVPSHVLDYRPIQISNDMSYEEQSIEIQDMKQQILRRRVIPLVKVRWANHSIEEATWEREIEIKKKYSQLFEEQGEVLNFEDEISLRGEKL